MCIRGQHPTISFIKAELLQSGAMRCYIGFGSNSGDRKRYIEKAICNLKKIKGIEVRKVSSIYETEPVGGPVQRKYFNGVIEIDTVLKPHSLLHALQDIENKLGRKRTIKDGPRTIDLDILTYGDLKIDEPDLKIPHPRMKGREFVLKPLREIMTRDERRECQNVRESKR